MRYILCEVKDEYISGSGVVIGAAGSGNDVILRLAFGVNWKGLNKYVTFRDALGENPVEDMLFDSALVPGTDNTYDVKVPHKAKAKQGKMMVTVTGYRVVNGVQEDSATNTTTAYFRVLPSDYALLDDGSIDATLAQQLQAEIEAVRENTTFKDLVKVVSSSNGDEKETEILPGRLLLKHNEDYYIGVTFDDEGNILFNTSAVMPSGGIPQVIYTSLSHPKMDLTNPEVNLEREEKVTIRSNIGLSQVDNTSDADKPVSRAQAEALELKADKKNPEIEGTVTLDGAKIYRDMTEDEYGNVSGEVIIERPSNGYATDVALKIGESLIFDKNGKVYELYHRGNLKNLFDEGTEVTDPERNAALTNLGITKTVKTESLDVGGAEISVEKDDEGCVVIHRPMSQGYVPDSTLKMGYDFLTFNGNTVYHSGNLKDLTLPGNGLDDFSKDVFMTNTGLDAVLGDVESTLDGIIEMQNTLIGGETE